VADLGEEGVVRVPAAVVAAVAAVAAAAVAARQRV